MRGTSRYTWRIGLAAVLVLALVPVLYASGLLDRDQRRLERAREVHTQEVERALAIYTTRVERANSNLERVYAQLIERYERRDEQNMADQLRRELDEITSSVLVIDDALEGEHGDEDTPRDDGYDELINAIGPSLVDANGRLFDSRALREANYVILFFSAQWCGPCRRFTPNLIEFHHQYSQRARIAVVYVSADRSVEQMMQYLQSRDMPFLAVPHHRVEQSGLKRKFNSRGGIPKLVVLDRGGEIVVESGSGGSPRQVLHTLADQLP